MILVTGGPGFIGSHTARALLDLGESQDTYLDISRIHQDTAYRPEYGVERGMADYINWLTAGHEH